MSDFDDTPDASGRRLERLVYALRKKLDGPDAEIVVRKRFYEDGVTVAEVDVFVNRTLSGKSHLSLFECRDRPANNGEGIPWIRELHGKRAQLEADAVVAVSTTGFKPQALALARRLQIPCLTVAHGDPLRLSQWFKNIEGEFHMQHVEWRLNESTATVDPTDPQEFVPADLSTFFATEVAGAFAEMTQQNVWEAGYTFLHQDPLKAKPLGGAKGVSRVEAKATLRRFDTGKVPLALYPFVAHDDVTTDYAMVATVQVHPPWGSQHLMVTFTRAPSGAGAEAEIRFLNSEWESLPFDAGSSFRYRVLP